MKRYLTAIAAAALLLSVSGCSDATAKLNDSKTKILTVGKTSITKGDIYDLMKDTYGAKICVDRAQRRIALQTIETTDEIEEKAQTYVDNLKDAYADTWDQILEEDGGTEEDIKNTYIESLKVEQLKVEYINDHWDELCEKYQPKQAIVLSFTDGNEAAYCTRALQTEVLTVDEAAEEYGAESSTTPQLFTIDSTDYDTEVRSKIMSMTPEDDWTYVANDDQTTYYVIHVESDDPNEFKDDIITELCVDDGIEQDAITYFFEKYNFHVYDINLYNAINNEYSYALVQEVPASAQEE